MKVLTLKSFGIDFVERGFLTPDTEKVSFCLDGHSVLGPQGSLMVIVLIRPEAWVSASQANVEPSWSSQRMDDESANYSESSWNEIVK